MIAGVRGHIGLPHHHVGRGIVNRRHSIIDQHTVVAGVSDIKFGAIGVDRIWIVEGIGSNTAALISGVRDHIGLTHNHVGRGIVRLWHSIMDQHTAVEAVSDI